jgi:arylsulfatase A-like enzyme
MLEIADAEKLPGMDSKSLLPVLKGKTEKHRDFACTGLCTWRAVIKDNYKLLIDMENGEELSLYDLEKDPFEENDISKYKPETVESLRKLITYKEVEK